ncbi:uncharacterized protein LOC119554186 [Drosophila subpulchrella]|uniref:uncharacterized protein LOC119554186 n=1 Tax=Drosophila subpulchrella TaxID=1486046 RepID=UPI0018A13A8F|nr:uncharacterized protein LOC119554186 [Drosophila subpulchrella]
MAACNILNLPVEVLALIFKDLFDIKDKLNLAEAHPVLGKAFAFQAGNTYKKIDFEQRPAIEWSKILSFCGSSVSRISSRSVGQTVVLTKLASMFCPNLEELFIPVRSHFWNDISPLLSTLQNLKWVGFSNDFDRVNVVDTMLKLPKLNNLQLVKFNRQDMERLKELVNLENLSIFNNKKMDPVDIYKVCSSMKNMDSLEIHCGDIRIPNYLDQDQLWPKIELLRIGYGFFYSPLPYLPTLKYLTIDNTEFRMKLNKILRKTVTKYGKTLESLRFCPETLRCIDLNEAETISKLKALKRLECQLETDLYIDQFITRLQQLEILSLQNSSNITNAGIILLLNRCKKLRLLDIFGCRLIDSTFLSAAAALLRKNGVQPHNPLVIKVGFEFGAVSDNLIGDVLRIEGHNTFQFFDLLALL